MDKNRQTHPKSMGPLAARESRSGSGRSSRGGSTTVSIASNKPSSKASGKAKTRRSAVRKPRIAQPRPHMYNVEVQGIGPLGGGGIPGLGGIAPGGGAGLPGLGGFAPGGFAGLPGFGGAASGGTSGPTAFGDTRAASGGGFLSFFNRIGGLDGIITTMTKVQKVYGIMRQMAPIFKLLGSLGGFFGGPRAKTASLRPHSKKTAVRKKKRR